MRIGATSSLTDASGGGGGTCSYDDEGSYDCTGGSYGGVGGGWWNGEESDPIPGSVFTPDEPASQCQANCDYPSGNNNGDTDPCVDAAGNNTCQVVEIPGQRPPPEEPAELVGCRPVNAFTVECGRLPPVIGGEPQELPGRTPWFPQAMCDIASIFCSAGQEPDNERGSNSSTSGKSMEDLYIICEEIEAVERDLCRAHRGGMDKRSLQVCFDKAYSRMFACYATARELTDKGAHPAP